MFTIEEIGVSPVFHRLLQLFAQLCGAKRVLEIGTFIGVTAMVLARALPKDGQLITLEKFDHFASIANKNFIKNGLSNKILVRGMRFGNSGFGVPLVN